MYQFIFNLGIFAKKCVQNSGHCVLFWVFLFWVFAQLVQDFSQLMEATFPAGMAWTAVDWFITLSRRE
jgi:hypothetical protein